MVLLLDDGDIVATLFAAITAFGCCGESKAADVPVSWVTLIVFPCWACCWGFEAVGQKFKERFNDLMFSKDFLDSLVN